MYLHPFCLYLENCAIFVLIYSISASVSCKLPAVTDVFKFLCVEDCLQIQRVRVVVFIASMTHAIYYDLAGLQDKVEWATTSLMS